MERMTPEFGNPLTIILVIDSRIPSKTNCIAEIVYSDKSLILIFVDTQKPTLASNRSRFWNTRVNLPELLPELSKPARQFLIFGVSH